jgi:outer membrane receptor for ferrienterochelin and colicin
MRYILLPVAVIIVSLLVPAHNIYASTSQELSIEELLELDVIDLAKVKISIASKREEKISEAPSIISIITEEDIERFGAKNLKDILQRVPSIQGIGSHFYPHLISMRGQMIGHNNSDILFLINGRPNRTSWNGGTPYRLLLTFPIDTIERIEIIRGPGSVLYGTGAFTGVIDIITKSAQKVKESTIGATAGSYKSYGLHATTGTVGDQMHAVAGARLFNTDGWPFTATDENGVTNSVDMKEENAGLMLTAGYGIAEVNLLYTDVKLNNIGGPPVWPASKQTAKHLLFDIGLPVNIAGDWTVENHLTYNRFDFSFLNTGLLKQERNSGDLLIETTLKGKFADNFNALVGATYEHIGGTISTSIDYDAYRYSLYTQGDYLPGPDDKITAGFQLNKVENVDSDISPRLGYVHQFNGGWGSKLLYGEGFRSAVATEQLLPPGSGGVVGSPSLDPERIKTFEAQLYYSEQVYFAALTVFKSKISDVIDRVEVSPGNFQFVNVPGQIDSSGVELESKASVRKTLQLSGSISYQQNEDDNGNDVTLAPKLMVKLGASYVNPRGYSVGLFNSFFGDPVKTSEVEPLSAEVNPVPESYNLLTAQLVMDIPRFFSRKSLPNMTLSIFADNLLDEDIYYPEINRKLINSIPIYSGRAVYTTLEMKI